MSDSLWPHGLYSPWNSPGQNTGVGSLSLLQGIFPTLGLEPRCPTLKTDSLPGESQGKSKNTGVGSLTLVQQIFPTQELNQVSCIAGGFLTNWAIREVLFSSILKLSKHRFQKPVYSLAGTLLIVLMLIQTYTCDTIAQNHSLEIGACKMFNI